MESYGFRPVACPDTVITTVESRAVEYHTVRVLGHGSHGSVYELQDAHTAELVAAKVIPKVHLQQQKEQQHRFQQQLSVQQALQHRHIVSVLGSCEDSNNIYVLMEPCTGVSLEDLLQQHGPLSEQQAATVLSQVLPALAYLHQQGLTHGNLQLKCLLLHSSGCIKLCGFGSAAQMPEGGQACTDVGEIGVMLYTMLLGQPPAGHMSREGTPVAASGSTAVQLCFPQQPALSAEAKELLAALLRPGPEQQLGLAEISCHPFMLHWLGKPCCLSSTGASVADTPAAAAVNSCLALDIPSSSCAVGSRALEQYIDQLQQQVLLAANAAAAGDAAGSATGSSPAVLNASWQLPPECIAAGSWDNSDSCSSSESANGGGDLAKHMSLDLMSSSPQLTPESSPLPEQLLLQQQQKETAAAGSRGGDQWPAGQQQQHHARKCVHIDAAGPSFSGWGSAIAGHGSSGGSSNTTHNVQHGQHYGVEQLHQALQRADAKEAARATCHSVAHLWHHQQQRLDQLGGQQQQHRQQVHSVTSASLAERRSSHDGAGVAVPSSMVGSGSLPDLPSSFSLWGAMGHVESSMQHSQSLAGSHSSDPARQYGSPLGKDGAAADATSSGSRAAAAAAAIHSPAQGSDSSPAGPAAAAAAAGPGSGSGSSSKVPRAVPPSPLQVPKSPRPHSMYVPAAAAPAAAAAAQASAAAEPSNSSSSSMPAPTPPPPGSGGSFATCASPKVAILLRHMAGTSGSGGSSGSGAAGAAALASPAVSPPVPMAARMHSHNLGSTGKDIMSQMQPALAEMPRSPAAAGLMNKPVCRDISDRLQACTDAQQLAAAAQGWQGAWQQQQQQREHDAGAAAAGSSQHLRHRLPADSDHNDNMQQQQQPVHSRSAPLPRGMNPAGAISPAPPPVPPSPLQQQAAELRAGGRRSCSNIPASPGSQMMADGWRPTPRRSAGAAAAAAAAAAAQSSSLGMSPGAAALCVNVGVMSAVPPGLDAASPYQGPGSPSIQVMLRAMTDSLVMESYTAEMPGFADGNKGTGGSGEVNPQLAELVNSSFGSSLGDHLPAMPTRAKSGNFGMHLHHQQQGMTSLGSGSLLQLNRPAGLSDHGLSSMGSGRVSEQVLARLGHLLDHGVPFIAGTSSGNFGRLSDQGTVAPGVREGPSFAEQHAAANLKALALNVLPNKQQQQQQHVAPRPPLHHAHSHDWAHTPNGSALAQLAMQRGTSSCQQQPDQQQQQQGVHGRGLRRSLSEDQQQLTQRAQQQQLQQHPVPPKEQQPLCRSPGVSMRAVAAVPAFLSGQLQPHICSPVQAQQQQQQQTLLSNASSGDCRLMLLGGGSDSRSVSSRGGTPAGTPLSSTGRYPISMGPPSGGAAAVAASAAASLGGGPSGSSSGGRADGAARQQLPRPAFEQFLNMGLDMSPVSAPAAAAAGSSSCSPMDLVSAAVAAGILSHGGEQLSPQQQQQKHQQLQPSFQQLRHSISMPVAGSSSSGGGIASDAATGHHNSSNLRRSVSGSGAAASAGQGHSFTPHPPTSSLGGLLSPRAGFQIPGVQGSAGAGVQPCPPHGIQPPGPSPSVKARVAHGNFILSHMPHVPHQYLLHQQHTWQPPDVLGAAGPGSSSGSGTHSGAAVAPCRKYSASAADVHHLPPSSSSSGDDAGASSSHGGSSSAGNNQQRSRSTMVDAKLWEGSCSLTLPDVQDEGQCELQLGARGKSAADAGEGSCSTPNMDWPAEAPSVELLQEQAEQQQQQQQLLDVVQRDVHASCQQGSAAGRQCASTAAGAPDEASAGTGAGSGTNSSSSSSRRAGLQQRSPHCRAAAAAAPAGAADAADQDASTGDAAAAAAAAAAGHLEGCPGWPSPVVAAFSYCKGRLGYLMSSGVVGVVFEDSTHMFVRSSDGWACYHEHRDSSSTAACGGTGPVVLLESGSPAGTAAGSKSSSMLDSLTQQQYRRSSDTGRNDPSALKDQDSPLRSSPAAAAAAAKSEASASPQAASAAALTFLLPGCSSPRPATAAADRSSSTSAAPGAAGVPEHLAGKARCMRRFVGCLLHHRPYSSSCQPDITRLPFPVAGKGLAGPAAAAAAAAVALRAQQEGCASMHAGVPHLRSFVHREGCLHLMISDDCHQFVFTGDNSVLLLDAQCSQLAYITHSKARRSSRHQAAAGAAPAADTAVAAAAAAAGMAHVQVLAIGRGAAAAPPADARLLARVAYASKLVRALQLPASWLAATSSSSASVSAVQGTH